MCLVFPTSPDLLSFKFIFFVFLFGINIFFKLNKFKFFNAQLIWICTLCFHGLFFSILGYINNGVGAIKMIQVSFLWPFFYFILFSFYENVKLFKLLHAAVKISAILISIISLALLFSANFLDFSTYVELNDKISFGSNIGLANIDSIFGFTIPGLMSMPFILGYLAIYFIENSRSKLFFILFVIIALLSGRNAVYLIILLFPLFYLLISRFSLIGRVKRIAFIYLFYFLLWIVVYLFALNYFSFDLKDLFLDNFSNSNNGIREKQAFFLLEGFYDNFFLGEGLGVPNYNIIRNSISPWSYELSYHAMLFQTGIIGTVSYLLILVIPILIQNFNFLKLLLKLELNNRICFSFGILSLLLANFTNPYFYRFDAIWIIVLIPFFLMAFNFKKNH